MTAIYQTVEPIGKYWKTKLLRKVNIEVKIVKRKPVVLDNCVFDEYLIKLPNGTIIKVNEDKLILKGKNNG